MPVFNCYYCKARITVRTTDRQVPVHVQVEPPPGEGTAGDYCPASSNPLEPPAQG